MDAPQAQVAPAPPPPPASVAQLRPATEEQADLCHKAGQFAWEYLGTLVLADAGTVILDSQALQSSGHAGVRMLGPGLIGLTWGWTVGGTYLTLPQCSSGYAGTLPPEGETRSVFPLAISFSVLAAAMGPVIVGVETGEGPQTYEWSAAERTMRLVVAGATGVVGSVMPYVLPPRTWRAMRKLDHLRAGATQHGAMLSYGFTF